MATRNLDDVGQPLRSALAIDDYFGHRREMMRHVGRRNSSVTNESAATMKPDRYSAPDSIAAKGNAGMKANSGSAISSGTAFLRSTARQRRAHLDGRGASIRSRLATKRRSARRVNG